MPRISDADLWIRSYHPAATATTKLVCLPHAGGSASYFFPVSARLSPAVQVLAVQYPGRQDRRGERCIKSIAELADALVPYVLAQADRPLALFGHSMGASLAFELAQRLEDRAVIPLALFVSGRRAPSRHHVETTHQLDDEGLLREMRALGGTHASLLVDDELIRMALPAIRGDYTAAETYRWVPGPPLRTPIHVYTGRSDPRVTLDEASAWREHTTAGFSLTPYSGGHFFLNDHAAQITEAIGRVITAGVSP
ncbi:thioesterase II family protein [Actinoplanes couchii]|uniref:thioesterase II family protein n=1 Tax=Actinoplanes couchii TaxID=403638 RepID=UPI001944EC5C|nr:alpha/beta fold hydrolase [Actinoplanes couchii]MDR6315945.1 surfactin synthase thioesterase subunit [Actinoplanes couchii]